MKDQETMLKLMRFWLFGTFVIVIAATTVLMGTIPGLGGLALFGTLRYWLAVILTAVLCVAWYYIYKWYLGRKG